jgi:hypothetical protein
MMSRLKESEVERIERLPPTVLVNVRGIDILAKSARLAEIARESDPFNEVLADTTNMGDVVTSLINTMSVQHVICPQETAYIISDNPTCPCDMWGMPMIFLPLSPKNALVFFKGTLIEGIENSLGVNLFNVLQVHEAIRYAFSTKRQVLQQAGEDSRLLR